jgi:hypothetical protein
MEALLYYTFRHGRKEKQEIKAENQSHNDANIHFYLSIPFQRSKSETIFCKGKGDKKRTIIINSLFVMTCNFFLNMILH